MKMMQKKKKKKKMWEHVVLKKMNINTHCVSCVNVTNMSRLPSYSTYEMKNCWLVSLGRKEDIGRKTCSHGNTVLGFIHRVSAEVPRISGTILEIISVSVFFCVSQARWGLHKIICLMGTTCLGATWGDPQIPSTPIFWRLTANKKQQSKSD